MLFRKETWMRPGDRDQVTSGDLYLTIDHITRVLRTLHYWLPVKYRVQFRLLTLIYKVMQNGGPSYIHTCSHNTTHKGNFAQRTSCCLKCVCPGRSWGTEPSPTLLQHCGTVFHLFFARLSRLMPSETTEDILVHSGILC